MKNKRTSTNGSRPMDEQGARLESSLAVETGTALRLLPEDKANLKSLERKLQMVRDRVGAVVHGYATGCYVFGEGGVGKSYTILGELERRKADYVVFNSRMTGRGLYNSLERFPSSIHLLEDMEGLFRDKGAQGVLRSALWAQRSPDAKGPLERLVTWTTWKQNHSCYFTGGIIMTGNRPMPEIPELLAVKTRIPILHLEVTAHELRAKMREISLKGYLHDGEQMDPEECWTVCEYVIEKSLAMRRLLDLRLLINSFNDYLQWQEGEAGCHWKDLVNARIQERPSAFKETVVIGDRASRKLAELELLEEIIKKSQDRSEQLHQWQESTGKSQPAFYRRLAELQK